VVPIQGRRNDHEKMGRFRGSYDLVVSPNEQVDPRFCLSICLATPFRLLSLPERTFALAPLNRQQLDRLEIPLHPPPKQRKIAGVLGLVQRASGPAGKG